MTEKKPNEENEKGSKEVITEFALESKNPARLSEIGGVRLLIKDDAHQTYANGMTVFHSSDWEFRLHFYDVSFGDEKGPIGVVKSIVIVNPSLIRSIISALQTNLKSYEEKFGKIEEKKLSEETLAKARLKKKQD